MVLGFPRNGKAHIENTWRDERKMANKPSDWLLYGGLAVANGAAGLALLGVNAGAWLGGLGGIAALAVTVGAVMKLWGQQ